MANTVTAYRAAKDDVRGCVELTDSYRFVARIWNVRGGSLSTGNFDNIDSAIRWVDTVLELDNE